MQHDSDADQAKYRRCRALWTALHQSSTGYPLAPTPEEQQAAQAFVSSLGILTGCADCKNHYDALLQALPPRLGSRQEFFEWSVDAHNQVNARLGKPTMTYDQATLLHQFSNDVTSCSSCLSRCMGAHGTKARQQADMHSAAAPKHMTTSVVMLVVAGAIVAMLVAGVARKLTQRKKKTRRRKNL